MATKAQKVKVGVFLVVNVVVITVALLIVAGFRRGNQIHYHVVFNTTVLGLYVGGVVEYLGVQVGTVDDIYVGSDGMAYVDIVIDPRKVTLHEGVEATLTYYSFATGTMCVALTGGDPNSPPLPPGSEIPAGTSLVESFSTQFTAVMDAMTSISEKINTGLENMESGQLTDTINEVKDFIKEAKGFVEEARETMATLTDDVHGSVDDVKEGIRHFNELADSASSAITTFEEKVKPLDLAKTEEAWREQFETVAKRFDETAKTFQETAATVNYGTDNLQHSLVETMTKLNETLEAVRDLALYLQQDPSSIIRGKGSPRGGN